MSAQVDSVTTYRKITEADLGQVASIERAVHAHPWTLGNFLDSLGSEYQCWLAERAGEIVGYGVVMVAAGEAHLLNLSVAPVWQRRGVGTELTCFVTRLARDCGADRIFLEVRPSNVPARALYTRLGFSVIGLRRDYYPAGEGREDAVVMELKLA